MHPSVAHAADGCVRKAAKASSRGSPWASIPGAFQLPAERTQQALAGCHCDGFGTTQDIEFPENRLHVALDGDLADQQCCADELVWLTLRQQSQDFQFSRCQLLRGEAFGQLGGNHRRKKRLAAMNVADALE